MAVISQPTLRVHPFIPTAHPGKERALDLRSVELHCSRGRCKTPTLYFNHSEISKSFNDSLPFRRQDLLAPHRSPRGAEAATCRTPVPTCQSVDGARASRRSFVVGVTAVKPVPRLIPSLARRDSSTYQFPSQVRCRLLFDTFYNLGLKQELLRIFRPNVYYATFGPALVICVII